MHFYESTADMNAILETPLVNWPVMKYEGLVIYSNSSLRITFGLTISILCMPHTSHIAMGVLSQSVV